MEKTLSLNLKFCLGSARQAKGSTLIYEIYTNDTHHTSYVFVEVQIFSFEPFSDCCFCIYYYPNEASIWIAYQLYRSYHGGFHMNRISTLCKLPWVGALKRKMSVQVKKYYYCYFIAFIFSRSFALRLLGHCTWIALISTLFISISAWVLFPGISSFWLRDPLAVQMLCQIVRSWDLPFQFNM